MKPLLRWLAYSVIAAFFGIWFTGCSGNPTIATVGSDKITANDLKSDILRRVSNNEENAASMPLENRLDVLNTIITRHLQLLDAYNKKIDQRPEIVRELNDYLLRNAQQKLYDEEVRDKVIKESEAKDYWKHQDAEVRASHILIAVTKTATPAEKNAAKARIDSIYNVVTKPNADFSAISLAVTQDMSARDGDIGWFRWGRMVDEFQNAVWNMKVGEISKPFLSQYGWHIAKLTDRRSIDRPSFDVMHDQIIQSLMQIHRNEMVDRAQKFLDELMKDYELKSNTANIVLIESKTLPSSNPQEDPFSVLSPTEKDLPLVTIRPLKNNWGPITEKPYYKAGKVTVQALIDKFTVAGRPGTVSDTTALRMMATQVAQEWVISDYVVDKGFTKNKSVVKESNRSIENDLIARAEAEQVTDRVSHPSDNDLQMFLAKNQSRFQSLPSSDIVEILFLTRAEADKYAMKARKRGNIPLSEAARLTKRVATPDNSQKVRGKLVNVSPSMFGQIGASAGQAPVGEIVGPIPDGKYFSVFQITAKNPPHNLALAEAHDQVAGAYRQEKMSELRKDWLDNLRKKFPVNIREEGVRSLFGGIKPQQKPALAPKMNQMPNGMPDPHGGMGMPNPHAGGNMNPHITTPPPSKTNGGR